MPRSASEPARLWHREKLKRQYRKQAREAAKQGARAAEKTAAASEKLVEQAVGVVRRHPVGVLLLIACVLLLVVMQNIQRLGSKNRRRELRQKKI